METVALYLKQKKIQKFGSFEYLISGLKCYKNDVFYKLYKSKKKRLRKI